MPTRDPRVEAYIARSADFAQPILKRLRTLVHAACPAVEETLKWNFPAFMYKGILCSMAAFKNHCTLGFWKHTLLFGPDHARESAAGEAMGQFGRITDVSELPEDQVLIGYIKQAVRLNDQGIKLPARPKSRRKKQLIVPEELSAALRKNKKALATFENFSPSHQREYVEWITEAKRQETRQQRLRTAMEWLAEGKPRNWKYMNC